MKEYSLFVIVFILGLVMGVAGSYSTIKQLQRQCPQVETTQAQQKEKP